MKIIIKTKNLKLNQVLRNFIEEKINSLERFLSKKVSSSPSLRESSIKEENFLVKAQIEIEKTTLHHKKGPFFRTECQIQLPGKDIRVESVSENLYLSINEVKDELQGELKNYKNKMTVKMKRGARVLKKEIHLSPLARLNFEKNFGGQAKLYRKGRIREESI
ncbi:MAG: ribosomal subunit interface protein [Candidatus Nealsonbacteria bacterium CG02_land_8_20_14_3_00_37_10]|uniref:Ribosomal subunit interface protein n=2 Tax=Candidatus Nealsoniibacteriota TaxID=1817911 RepID=A0A2G9YY82_9BACT|nr:MAG: ribosomal subunit interface protein [Candidatus Nealsonbacteria bacterium CG23_combo_of_CG06-09_8_20_14_all_37_18]PIV44891.1 MAG: ribosomal subunit interface protein [Candidatus Nealsonbacteria bacterium CG02_land_8_20_14_3_00_37_10]